MGFETVVDTRDTGRSEGDRVADRHEGRRTEYPSRSTDRLGGHPRPMVPSRRSSPIAASALSPARMARTTLPPRRPQRLDRLRSPGRRGERHLGRRVKPARSPRDQREGRRVTHSASFVARGGCRRPPGRPPAASSCPPCMALLAVGAVAVALVLGRPFDPVHAEVVQDGLEHPWDIAFAPDGRMLVTERAGSGPVFVRGGRCSAPPHRDDPRRPCRARVRPHGHRRWTARPSTSALSRPGRRRR